MFSFYLHIYGKLKTAVDVEDLLKEVVKSIVEGLYQEDSDNHHEALGVESQD